MPGESVGGGGAADAHGGRARPRMRKIVAPRASTDAARRAARQDRPGCGRPVERVEVDPGAPRARRSNTGASRKRRRALQPLPGRRRADSTRAPVRPESRRHLDEALDLAVVGDRHDPRHDRHRDAGLARLLDEVEVQLSKNSCVIRNAAGLLLLARVAQVAVAVGRVRVDLREAGGADAEVEALGDQPDQLDE